MKKKMIIAISSVSLAAVLGFGIYHSNAAQAEPGLSKEEIRALVEEQYPGTITELELDKGFNKAVYEVEVESNGKEYEIELDGNTGEILKLQEKEKKVAVNDSAVNDSNGVSIKEKNDDAKDKNTSSDDKNKVEEDKVEDSSNQSQKDVKDEGNQSNKNNTKNVVIDYEAAKKIALGEFQGTITELELDEDDGRLIYEIEIESSDGEAELEIDAYTGEIIYISIDSEIGTSNENNSNGDSDDQSDDLEDNEDWDEDEN